MSLVYLAKCTDAVLTACPALKPLVHHVATEDGAADTVVVLKVLNNLRSEGMDMSLSRTSHLSREHSAEYKVPLSLPPHPHVVVVLHHYVGSTGPFARFLDILMPPGLDVDVSMASRTTMVVMPQYKTSLKDVAELRAEGRPSPLAPGSPLLSAADGGPRIRGVYEREWTFVFTQALRAVTFLRENGVAHRDIKSDNLFMDGSGRVVLADFGGAVALVRPKSRRNIPFTNESQAACLNPMAWDPHVARLSRTGPPDDPDAEDDMTLADVYDKSDTYAVGRMTHDLLDPSTSARFPTSSAAKPHCDDAAIPELPASLSAGLRVLLQSLVRDKPDARPSAMQAWRRMGVLAFGPQWSLLSSMTADDVKAWALQEFGKAAILNGAMGDTDGRPMSVWEEERLAWLGEAMGSVDALVSEVDAMVRGGASAGAGAGAGASASS